ncbi:SDR family oxidoreductase [Gracilibacillus xinjiangensis]|uniref:SDR family oxidoreductase n=1 Tax=Gracilibacillus xinjiangensis TaxID=1193282 RepID=A0ABV8WXT1_9BACI
MVQNQLKQNSQNLTKAGKTSTTELENTKTNRKRNIKLKEIKDQVIVITGASSGIGLVTARKAAAQGAKLVLAARNGEALQQLVEELREEGHSAIYVKADVGKEEDVKNLAEAAKSEYGRFDTWVNNAGVSIYGHAMDVSTEDMQRMFETNFWGVVYGSKAAVEHFKERGVPGALINVGSLFGGRGTVLQSTYSASKFAVHGWTDNLRMELEKENAPVSVTLIHPGRIDTPYNEHARSYLDKQPTHKGMIYPPDAVAESILYAAANPKRDMYIGSQAKLFELVGALFPRFTDKLAEWYLYPTQHDNRPSNSTEESSLYHKGYGLHERGTNHGWMRSNSMYVKASKRPMLTLALVGGAALACSSMKKKKINR